MRRKRWILPIRKLETFLVADADRVFLFKLLCAEDKAKQWRTLGHWWTGAPCRRMDRTVGLRHSQAGCWQDSHFDYDLLGGGLVSSWPLEQEKCSCLAAATDLRVRIS